MDNLAELQRKKAELAVQIERQRGEIKMTVLEIREEIEPANLLKNAVSGALGFSKKKPGEATTTGLGNMSKPLSFIVDLLVKDPRLSLVLKLVSPLALKYLPQLVKAKSAGTAVKVPEKPMKAKVYGRLRRGISSLRDKLHKS